MTHAQSWGFFFSVLKLHIKGSLNFVIGFSDLPMLLCVVFVLSSGMNYPTLYYFLSLHFSPFYERFPELHFLILNCLFLKILCWVKKFYKLILILWIFLFAGSYTSIYKNLGVFFLVSLKILFLALAFLHFPPFFVYSICVLPVAFICSLVLFYLFVFLMSNVFIQCLMISSCLFIFESRIPKT